MLSLLLPLSTAQPRDTAAEAQLQECGQQLRDQVGAFCSALELPTGWQRDGTLVAAYRTYCT